jgi:hypothetical protein
MSEDADRIGTTRNIRAGSFRTKYLKDRGYRRFDRNRV